jgi:hypothetical protein
MIRRILKNTAIKFVKFNFKILINQVIKDKAVMPHKVVDEMYEIFDNINENKFFDKKITLPYEGVSILNRINIYKPYEILEVKAIPKNSILDLNFDKTKDLILPLAVLDLNLTEEGNDKILLSYGDNKVQLELKYKNRFHYLPVKSNTDIRKVQIQSDKRGIVIGRPINKDKGLLKNRPKLIVHIFVDALTQCMIEKFGYEIMPNTKKFFSNGGTFYTNTYAQSEWTLSSISGILTGKYTNEHLLYHPRREDKISDITIADVLSKEGYTTFSCTNVPKLTAINGFDKGFDRCILATEKDCNYIIDEACEQLDTFGGNQYQFLSFFDIHEAHTLQPISSQSTGNIKDFVYREITGNSKDTSILYDEERINMYKSSIMHFDKKIQRLYDAINTYDKEAMVILHSDHGVNFMTQTNELLGRERQKVVFLYKNNKSSKMNNNIKEIRELPSMICNDLNIKDRFHYRHDGCAITESLYPNKDYEIAIRDETSVLFFKVSWGDIVKGDVDNYKYASSYHPVDSEVEVLNKDKNYEKSFLIAKNHYSILCKTIEKKRL